MPDSPAAEFDVYAGDYDAALNRGLKFTGETKEYFAETRIHWLKNRLNAAAFTPRRCLDFGCGTGTSASLLLEGLNLEHYTGFDPSSESVAEAIKDHPEGPYHFVHDVAKLEPNSFDLAFCNGVFHHIPIAARAEAFQRVYQSVRPGGWFAFWENNKWNPIVHLLMSRVPFDRDAIMLFPGEAADQMRTAGFHIALRDYLFVFPASLKFLRPLEPMLCKLPLGGQYLILAQKK